MSRLPDDLLLRIFSYLTVPSLNTAARVSRQWKKVSEDESLWRALYHKYYSFLPPRENSYRMEFRSLYCLAPTEVVKAKEEYGHRHEILHVTFSPDGSFFVTCSKDGFFKVWASVLPVAPDPVHAEDMKASPYRWDHVIFGQYSPEGRHLLVCGQVQCGMQGEVAVFCAEDNYTLVCRMSTGPRPVCCAWYDKQHVLSTRCDKTSGVPTTNVYITKIPKAADSDTSFIDGTLLYKYQNYNYCDIQHLTVAMNKNSFTNTRELTEEQIMNNLNKGDNRSLLTLQSKNNNEYLPTYEDGYVQKIIITTQGNKAATPHKICFKKTWMDDKSGEVRVVGKVDEADASIDLEGHIVGDCLSPDHSRLYVKSCPWPACCDISNPCTRPLPSCDAKISTVNMTTFQLEPLAFFKPQEAGCCGEERNFIYLDATDDYIASGSEAKEGHLWSVHHGQIIATYPHQKMVSCVAFNPKDPGMLVTVSDDHTFKVWVSQSRYDKLYMESG